MKKVKICENIFFLQISIRRKSFFFAKFFSSPEFASENYNENSLVKIELKSQPYISF